MSRSAAVATPSTRASSLQMKAASYLDRASFETFYRTHGDALLRFFLRRTFDAHLSLEPTAETFATAFARRKAFPAHLSPASVPEPFPTVRCSAIGRRRVPGPPAPSSLR